ncbi:MAG: fasciclin domain-containing protein [Burkholderiaceae bacterium]
MKKLLSLLLALVAFCGSAVAQGEDIVAAAATDGSLKTFVRALHAAGLTDTLKDAGPYTIFAPTDHAFEKLPAGTLDTLMQDKVRLAQVLTYHIVPGRTLVAEIKPGEVKTVQGDLLKLTSDNGKITVNNANVIQSDITADNGVIHAIDAVLLPR